MKLIGVGPNNAVRVSDGMIGAPDKGSLEVRTAENVATAGWVVVRETGEFVGLLAEWKAQGRFGFLPACAIADLMKKKAESQKLEVAGAKEVLFDFRDSGGEEKSPTLSAQEEHFLFTSVFGPKPPFVEDEYVDCQEERDKCLAADRAAWRIRPEVRTRANGAFTRPGTQQTAYLIAVNERHAEHADNYGTKRLAIVEGQKLVVGLHVGDYRYILKTVDLDRDGTSELLLSGSYSRMGHTTSWSKLTEFKDGRQKVVNDVGDVYSENCGADTGGKMFGIQILYTPGARGSYPSGFRQDVYRSGCGDPPTWKYLPGGSLPSLGSVQ